jgi:hypothetical protein
MVENALIHVNFYKSAVLAAIPFLWSSLLGSNLVIWMANKGLPFPLKEVAIVSHRSNHRPPSNMITEGICKPDGYSFYRHYHLPMWFRVQKKH